MGIFCFKFSWKIFILFYFYSVVEKSSSTFVSPDPNKYFKKKKMEQISFLWYFTEGQTGFYFTFEDCLGASIDGDFFGNFFGGGWIKNSRKLDETFRDLLSPLQVDNFLFTIRQFSDIPIFQIFNWNKILQVFEKNYSTFPSIMIH